MQQGGKHAPALNALKNVAGIKFKVSVNSVNVQWNFTRPTFDVIWFNSLILT